MGHGAWVNLSCVWIVNLLLSGGMDGAVSGMGVFVDLTVPNTLEAARPGESRAEAADAGEHIEVTNQVIDHLLCLMLLQSAGEAVPLPVGNAEYLEFVQLQIQRQPTAILPLHENLANVVHEGYFSFETGGHIVLALHVFQLDYGAFGEPFSDGLRLPAQLVPFVDRSSPPDFGMERAPA